MTEFGEAGVGEAGAGAASIVVGVDEVGYGCIAGDVVVAAYAFRPGVDPAAWACAARDSKSFSSAAARRRAADLLAGCGFWRLDRASPAQIEGEGLRAATASAMVRAIRAFGAQVLAPAGLIMERLVVDGVFDPSIFEGFARETIVAPRQDVVCPQAGAASVMAKTARDAEMAAATRRHPGYGWERNVGYPTREHRLAVGRLGLSPLHRRYARAADAAK